MIVVDANLLIYAVNEDAVFHAKAKGWLEAVLTGTDTVGLPWGVLLAFLRLTTRAGVFSKPLPAGSVFDLIEVWLSLPNVITLSRQQSISTFFATC